MAERVGFEPTEAHASPVFKTGSFNRSDISPNRDNNVRALTLNYDSIRSAECQLPFPEKKKTAPPLRQEAGARKEGVRGLQIFYE